MTKWWCLLEIEKIHVSACSGQLQVLKPFFLKEFYIIYIYIYINRVSMLGSHQHSRNRHPTKIIFKIYIREGKINWILGALKYAVALMFIGPCIIVIVEELKPTRCHLLYFLYFLDTQHVSGINMYIFRSSVSFSRQPGYHPSRTAP